TLDKTTLDLAVGQTSSLTATVAPALSTNKNLRWTSDKTTVATVVNGVITAVAEGTANITVITEDGVKTSLCIVTVNAKAPPANKTFNIIEITDFHGQLLDSTNTKPVGAALAKVVKEVKASNPDRTLIIGGGDLYQGTPVSNVLRGVPVQKVMSNLGMEVTTLGNHEFDWGLDVINNETMVGAGYSIVCANMYKTGTNNRPYAPYKIITKDGVRIAVIGAILKDAPTIIMPALVAPFDFRDPATEINTVAKQIRDDKLADIVLADVHDGGASLDTIVNKLHGVDAVFGGHTHTSGDVVNKDADSKDVPTLNAASTGKGFINLKITVDSTNKIVSFSPKGSNWNALTITTSSPTDPTCKTIVDEASATLLPIFNVVIGNDTQAYTSGQLDSPYGESQLGNWMADVVKNYSKSPADVGMVNNGGIRLSPIPAGDITVGTIFNIMPFDNTICTTTMTGAQLKFIFEQAVQTNGKGIQISGVKFVYDSSKPSYVPSVLNADGSIKTAEVLGQRVLRIIRESNDTIVKDEDILKVNAPDFVATGGDTFTGFLVPSIVRSLVDSHYTVRDALTDNVKFNKKITVVMNNRVDNQMAVVAPIAMSISEARTTAKTAVILTGVVSAVSGKNVFMQDDTAGICIYNTAGTTFTAHKGDKVTVTGNLSVYNGLLEITPTSAAGVVTLSSGNQVIPKEVTVGSISDTLQGQLIKVKNVTFTSIDNAGASMAQDSTGSINVFAMPVIAGLVVGDTADVTAAVTRYSTSLELAVDNATDVVKVGATTDAKISVIGTSDLHGAIFPLDYNTGLAANIGLAKVSTYVESVRATNPNTMLIDNGDTIQGTPLAYYYNKINTTSEYPMMKVMGAMKYDTWTLGNHEFNYGLATLNRIIGDATKENIAVLSANTYKSNGAGFVKPYIIKSFIVNGKTIKVAILGLTTKTIPNWEDPAHYADLHFNDLVLEAQKWVPIIKAAGADVVIASIHSGIKGASDTIPENQVDEVAKKVSSIDAILCGHTHTGKTYTYTNPDGKVVPVVQPKNGDGVFSQIDINIDAKGGFTGVTAFNVTLPANSIADPSILALAQPYQDATLAYTKTVIGQSTAVFEGTKQLTEPSSIMELVNKVQANAAGTQLSIAAPLSLTAKVPKGDVKRQDIMGIYVYENYLFGLKMTGSQLKNWLEWSVRYYKQVVNSSDPIVKDSLLNIADYNLDQLYGATYDIDLTQPACKVDSNGKVITQNRIKNLKINGVLVKDTDSLKVAINNYRYNGGGGFMVAAGFVPGSQATIAATFYDSGKTLGDDGQVRNMMFKYVQDKKTISPTNSNNWKISTVAVKPNSINVTTLPKTGSSIDMALLIYLGGAVTGLGVFILVIGKKKGKKNAA
ncbi:MAG: 5'-nucleotidase C-terminal domain-containing protein, partial [Clostridiaceae bacterium]|nr:5'-nucleotidase C-terminal domain-containing protein [Clostridiaceae bacterium]